VACSREDCTVTFAMLNSYEFLLSVRAKSMFTCHVHKFLPTQSELGNGYLHPIFVN
jgi:hypothetical protein